MFLKGSEKSSVKSVSRRNSKTKQTKNSQNLDNKEIPLVQHTNEENKLKFCKSDLLSLNDNNDNSNKQQNTDNSGINSKNKQRILENSSSKKLSEDVDLFILNIENYKQVFKANKTKIIDAFTNLLMEKNIENVKLALKSSLKIYKDFNKRYEVYEQKSFYLLKQDKNINWSRNPHAKIISFFEEFIYKNPELKHNISFPKDNFISNYEKIPINLILKENKTFSDIVITQEESQNLILLFFNNSQINSSLIQIIQQLNEINHSNQKFKLFIIFSEILTNKQEADFNALNLHNIGINTKNLYFILKPKKTDNNDKIEKFFDFTKNSFIILTDNKGFIRYNTNINKFNIDLVESINNDLIDYKENRNQLLNIYNKMKNEDLNSSFKYTSSISLVKIYDFKTKEKIKLNYDQINIIEFLPNILSDIPKILDIKNLIVKKEMKKELRKEHSNIAIKNILCNIKENFTSIESLDYKIIYNILSKNISSLNNLSLKFIKTEIEFLVNESEGDEFTGCIFDQINIFRTFGIIPNFSSAMIMPKFNYKYSQDLILEDESIINLKNKTQKIFIILGDFNEQNKKIINLRLKELFLKIDKNNFQIEVFNKNNDNQFSELFDDFQVHTLPKNIHIHFDGNEHPFYNILLLDQDNRIQYIGTGNETSSICNLLQISKNNIIQYSELEKVSKEFKLEYKDFLLNIQKEFNLLNSFNNTYVDLEYKSINKYKDNSKIHKFLSDLSLHISISQKYKIVLKTDKITKFIEDFKAKYNGIIDFKYYDTIELSINNSKCCYCNFPINVESTSLTEYYYFIKENEVICVKCEKEMNNMDNPLEENLLYLRYYNSKIRDNIILDHYNANIKSNNPFDNLETATCAICNNAILDSQKIAFISLTTFCDRNNNDSPFIICNENCFSRLVNMDSKTNFTKEEKQNIYLSNFDTDNFILKKIILSDNCDKNIF